MSFRFFFPNRAHKGDPSHPRLRCETQSKRQLSVVRLEILKRLQSFDDHRCIIHVTLVRPTSRSVTSFFRDWSALAVSLHRVTNVQDSGFSGAVKRRYASSIIKNGNRKSIHISKVLLLTLSLSLFLRWHFHFQTLLSFQRCALS